MDRGKISIVEWDEPHQNYKINPLANWSFEQVREYVDKNNVPYNELHDRGYPSLGCAPCTRAITGMGNRWSVIIMRPHCANSRS